MVTAKVCTALTALGRADEAAEQYELACARTTLPSVHLQAAYGRAMLYTRFYDPGRRDHHKARAAIDTAIAISSLLPEDEQRVFNLTFNENGLALIAMHLGDPEEALALITDGLRRLDAELGVGVQTLHRSVLRYNRAQLLACMGRTEEAIAEYDDAIDADPNHSEYHLERAELHRRQGRTEQALADYTAAIATSPPYPEPYYNRADLSFELGELEAAVADFGHALDLDPGLVDASPTGPPRSASWAAAKRPRPAWTQAFSSTTRTPTSGASRDRSCSSGATSTGPNGPSARRSSSTPTWPRRGPSSAPSPTSGATCAWPKPTWAGRCRSVTTLRFGRTTRSLRRS